RLHPGAARAHQTRIKEKDRVSFSDDYHEKGLSRALGHWLGDITGLGLTDAGTPDSTPLGMMKDMQSYMNPDEANVLKPDYDARVAAGHEHGRGSEQHTDALRKETGDTLVSEYSAAAHWAWDGVSGLWGD